VQVCPLCVTETHVSSVSREGPNVSLKDFEETAHAFRRTYWGSDARARKVTHWPTPPARHELALASSLLFRLELTTSGSIVA